MAQSSGTIAGIVKDPSGGTIANATVEIRNPVSGFERSTTTDASGNFRFTNLPSNPYHMTVVVPGFEAFVQDVDVRSGVPVAVEVSLKIATASTTVTVEAGAEDLVENDPNFHTDVDRGLFDRLPLESQSSSVSSLVTLATPGVVADSNGLFHGIGDHAENSFSVDGQPITDQQSKVFSNQIPADSIQSLEVISGAPPAEFSDKTSLVIKVTTRSGLGQTKPVGSVTSSYGSFGSVNESFDMAFGGQKWGNFVSVSGLNTSRFLDPPEIQAIHDKGNEQNFFDRVDFQITQSDTVHLNLGYTRSWFQTPNSIDSQNVDFRGQMLSQDQRSLINTFNVAPIWTRLISSTTLFTLGAFVRQDQFNYVPSGNPFADLTETLNQQRRLTNAGARSDFSYVKGIHNVKAGITFQDTILGENFGFGITDPAFNAVCLNADGSPDINATPTDPAQCTGALSANPNFNPVLFPVDLTRGGADFLFRGRADIRETALYLQDAITKGHWTFNLGIRGDLYRGLVSDSQPEPRVGVAYNLKPSNTVLRLSYGRIMETPFNENLVLASTANGNPVISGVLGPSIPAPIRPGWRNEFHAGFEQAFGKHFVVDADYLWKYTHNAYDFSALGNTPIFFPIAWRNSKIDGASARLSVPNFHGLTAFAVLGHVKARFFPPQVGGLGTTVGASGSVFRIDHDQNFQQTTNLQYQPWKKLPWIAFNWRYDSGLVAGAVPFATSANPTDPGYQVDLTGLTADQQIQAGLFCGNVFPTFSAPLTTCPGNLYGSTRITIPAPGTENDDKNPPRIAPRNLFDASVGDDNLFHGDRYRWSLRLTAINLTNKVALYNFLSTFSGTHFVTPRSFRAELGFHF
jgi:hypothetical protein